MKLLVPALIAAVAMLPTFAFGGEEDVDVVNVHIEYLQESTDWCRASEGALVSIEMDGPEVGIWDEQGDRKSQTVTVRRGVSDFQDVELHKSLDRFNIEHLGRFETSIKACDSIVGIEVRGQWSVKSEDGAILRQGQVGPETVTDFDLDGIGWRPILFIEDTWQRRPQIANIGENAIAAIEPFEMNVTLGTKRRSIGEYWQ